MSESLFNAAAVLDVWEACRSEAPLRRGVALVAAASPDRSVEEWMHVSIGERDRCLLRLHEQCFGDQFEGLAVCPRCQSNVEVGFAAADVTCVVPDGAAAMLHVSTEGYDVAVRKPTTADLLSLTTSERVDDGRSLLAACVAQVVRSGSPCDVVALPDDVVSAIGDAMSRSDPQADVQIALTCPDCQHRWDVPFDVLSYVWGEIDEWAQRLLRQIHVLAREYGWSERDILALSPFRRQRYVDAIES